VAALGCSRTPPVDPGSKPSFYPVFVGVLAGEIRTENTHLHESAGGVPWTLASPSLMLRRPLSQPLSCCIVLLTILAPARRRAGMAGSCRGGRPVTFIEIHKPDQAWGRGPTPFQMLRSVVQISKAKHLGYLDL
jgi:hypothetical protein